MISNFWASIIFYSCWFRIFGFFMDLDNFVAVFGCSIGAKSISIMFDFCTVSSLWVVIFECSIAFDKLKAVWGCLIDSYMIYVIVVWYFVNLFCFGF